MRDIIKWVSEVRPDKDIGVAMTSYLVRDGAVVATNGRLTASHPWPDDSVFLVSGHEFEKVLARMDGDDPGVEQNADNSITVRSGRFHATIETLPPDTWAYPGVEADAPWLAVPGDFVDVLRSLRAFIPDNPAQLWMGCVAIEAGNLYATNGIAVAGRACDVGDVRTLLSAPAIDFVLRRVEGLREWYCCDNHIAFRWESGAWMRVQRVEGQFPERAATLVKEAYDVQPTQEITDEFREAFADVAGLAEDTIRIYGDRMESKFKKSVVVAPCECEVPPPVTLPLLDDAKRPVLDKRGRPRTHAVPVPCSIWGAAVLAPVIAQATHWSPSSWPKPASFRGDNVAGFVIGRKE